MGIPIIGVPWTSDGCRRVIKSLVGPSVIYSLGSVQTCLYPQLLIELTEDIRSFLKLLITVLLHQCFFFVANVTIILEVLLALGMQLI